MTLAAGRYRIERTLGSGGMAVVYLAHDEELHRRVAIKVLAEHLAGDDSFRARFLEYVPGDTIARRGKLSSRDAVPLALQACAGLQHAHAAGLVHRDVKPANLLVREDDVLKIADFGIARATELTRLTQHGTVLGTAAYLSPEQAAGEEVTAATDIYSLGAVVYELLTGRSPYEFESLAEVAAQQKGGVITPLRDLESSVPVPVEAAVMHALAREPRFRPASAADFADRYRKARETHGADAVLCITLAKPLSGTYNSAVAARDMVDFPVTEPLHSRKYRNVPGSSAWLWIVGAAAVAMVAVILGLLSLGGGSSSTKPQPVRIQAPARGATPAAEARNLSAWLRAHSR